MANIAWDDGRRRPSAEPRARIANVRERPDHFRLLGEPIGVWVHWHQGRSRPCLETGCRLCSGGNPARWAGYVPALLSRSTVTDAGETKHVWEPVVLALTSEAVEQLAAIAGGAARDLIVSAERAGRGPRARIRLKAIERAKHPTAAAVDVRAVLCRVWGVRDGAAGDVLALRKRGAS